MWKRSGNKSPRAHTPGSVDANGDILRSLLVQLTIVGALLVACGLVYWWIEPRAPTLADGLWLAFVTASTVGYGDVVPSTPASRIFSVVVVLLGFAVLSLVTAAIAAALVGSQERNIEREILRDLHREIAAVRADIAVLRGDAERRLTAPTGATAGAAAPRKSASRPIRTSAR